MTLTTAEALRQCDVTTAAWRLTIDASQGKPIHQNAAINTLIIAGADPETAKVITTTVLSMDHTHDPAPDKET